MEAPYADVLVCVDGSEQARYGFEHALALAKQTKAAQLHLLHVVRLGVDVLAQQEVVRQKLKAGAALLEQLEEEASRAGVLIVTAQVVRGSPQSVIESVARQCDLAVLGGSSKSTVEKHLIGSVTASLIRSGATNVLVASGPLRRSRLDSSPDSSGKTGTVRGRLARLRRLGSRQGSFRASFGSDSSTSSSVPGSPVARAKSVEAPRSRMVATPPTPLSPEQPAKQSLFSRLRGGADPPAISLPKAMQAESAVDGPPASEEHQHDSFLRILAPIADTEQSRQALQQAVEVARSLQASLTLLHISDHKASDGSKVLHWALEIVEKAQQQPLGIRVDDEDDDEEEDDDDNNNNNNNNNQKHDGGGAVGSPPSAEKVPVFVKHIMSSDDVTKLIQTAAADYDLVVMATHRRSKWEKLRGVGSVTEGLLQDTETPVLIPATISSRELKHRQRKFKREMRRMHRVTSKRELKEKEISEMLQELWPDQPSDWHDDDEDEGGDGPQAADDDGRPAFSMSLAEWLVHFAHFAYLNIDFVLSGLHSQGFKLFEAIHDKATDTYAYVALDQKRVVVSFAGTNSLKNLLTDAHALMCDSDWPDPDNPEKRCRVHRGFLRAYKSVRSEILTEVLDAIESDLDAVDDTGLLSDEEFGGGGSDDSPGKRAARQVRLEKRRSRMVQRSPRDGGDSDSDSDMDAKSDQDKELKLPPVLARAISKESRSAADQDREGQLPVGRGEDQKRQVYITGHSLGGVLATFLAVDLGNTFGIETVCYTFGCPRIGDAAFVRRVLKDVSALYRVNNESDIVQALPPKRALFKRYHHAPTGIILRQSHSQHAPPDSLPPPEPTTPGSPTSGSALTVALRQARGVFDSERRSSSPGILRSSSPVPRTGTPDPLSSSPNTSRHGASIPVHLLASANRGEFDVEYKIDNTERRLRDMVRVSFAKDGSLLHAHTTYGGYDFPTNPFRRNRDGDFLIKRIPWARRGHKRRNKQEAKESVRAAVAAAIVIKYGAHAGEPMEGGDDDDDDGGGPGK